MSNELNNIYSFSAGQDQSESIHFIPIPLSEAHFWLKMIVFQGELNALSVVKTQGFSAFIRHQNIAKIRDPYDHGVCLHFG